MNEQKLHTCIPPTVFVCMSASIRAPVDMFTRVDIFMRFSNAYELPSFRPPHPPRASVFPHYYVIWIMEGSLSVDRKSRKKIAEFHSLWKITSLFMSVMTYATYINATQQ